VICPASPAVELIAACPQHQVLLKMLPRESREGGSGPATLAKCQATAGVPSLPFRLRARLLGPALRSTRCAALPRHR
jgi:hypothetical protein